MQHFIDIRYEPPNMTSLRTKYDLNVKELYIKTNTMGWILSDKQRQIGFQRSLYTSTFLLFR